MRRVFAGGELIGVRLEMLIKQFVAQRRYRGKPERRAAVGNAGSIERHGRVIVANRGRARPAINADKRRAARIRSTQITDR